MWRAELATQFRRRRTKVLLLVLAAVPAMLAVAVYLSGGPQAGNGPTFLDQVTHNGVFAALAGLTVTLPFFLPLTVAVMAGATISGEASLRTRRYLLVRPARRPALRAGRRGGPHPPAPGEGRHRGRLLPGRGVDGCAGRADCRVDPF